MKFILVLQLLLASLAMSPDVPRGEVVDEVEAVKYGGTYAVYLPSNYTEERAWPIIYILDPRARGAYAAKQFRVGAEKYGYIIASSNRSQSDTPEDLNYEALQAMWKDARDRFRVDGRRSYLAGFSGTARSAIDLARGLPAGTITGVIGAGAGHYADDPPRTDEQFVYFGAIGDKDFNWQSVIEMEPSADAGVPYRLEVFDGAHQWPPEPTIVRAFAWLELQAMKARLRPVDQALVEEWWQGALKEAAAAESAGDFIQAHRIWSGAATDFSGLRDVDLAMRRTAAIAEGPQFNHQVRERKWLVQREKRHLARLRPALVSEHASMAISDLGIDALKKRAQSDSSREERNSASRILNTFAVVTGFYLARDHAAAERWERLLFVLSIAAKINPDNGEIFYRRAVANARLGYAKKAIADLKRAVANGKDLGDLASDAAFESIRKDSVYRQQLESLDSGRQG